MKKWLKHLAKVFIGAVLLLALLETGLYVLSRTQWFDARLESALKNALGREVKVGRKGINLRGVFVENIQIAEKDGFENGTFVQADRLRVRFSLIHLLHAHAQVNLIVLSNATVRATTYQDGTSSWDNWTMKDTPKVEEKRSGGPSSLHITARHIRFEQLRLIYVDERAPRTLDISGLTLDVKNFSLAQDFPLTLVAEFYHKENSFEWRVPLTLNATVNLAQLELEKAYAHIKAFKAFYKNSSLTLSGNVENFINPQADLKIELRRVSSALFEDAMNLPAFDLPQADLTLKLASDLEKQTVTLHHLSLQTSGVDMKAKGNLSYKDKLQYEATAHVNLLLGELGRWFTAIAEPYQAIGTLESNLTATHERMSAIITFSEVGAELPHTGRLANLNGQISAQESMDFKTGQADIKINGKLNANPFKLDFTAQQTAEKIKAVLNATANELLLPTNLQADAETAPTPVQETPNPTQKSTWPLPPIELKANVQLGKVNVPYFVGKDVVFTSDLDGITPDLNQAHGVLRLTTGEGKIQDIYKLTSANALTKVLFLSLNVTGKVFNSLNVLGVLNSLGSGVISAVSGGNKEDNKPVKTQTILGPDGEPLEVPVTETDKQVSGEMEYDKFDTEVNFVRGLATIKKGTFVSPTMSFRLDGTADFNSGKLDMTVHAAPGRHEVNGMMPLSLKIGGTVDDPQGNMQVLGSVTSLVTQSVTNNVVSRNVTKGIKGIFGLFKKKEKDTEEPENTTP